MLIDKLFVYGLLKKGYPNYSLIEPYIITSIDAYTFGSLYMINDKHPAYIKSGNNKIEGTLYFISNTKIIFKILDYIEQGYKREVTTVYDKDNNEYLAWIYTYLGNLKDAKLLPEGKFTKKYL
ncbi:conserved hypothetical protein [Deferribacter desulfuricans SSM1]|uniref:Gamma-glutamylcyclotransferase AIG2-like domain-containing protein n=1 Tax=Deferribacter desulfuricans (strain DSM 14783 / JCM 11476 / NBRC 101012 / SSM1) TaxID=639282 RepID=D3P9J4_DEFDS|nr:gamma-glutamylcyclotransferase family protein [Deferribacter desulfuricans]BAI81384.1 conserved hypothetical protein [Deferribacter desulfuricans SSM1]